MTKKDYERAAEIVQEYLEAKHPGACTAMEAFVEFFEGDGNPRWDEARFRRACVPGANVRARR